MILETSLYLLEKTKHRGVVKVVQFTHHLKVPRMLPHLGDLSYLPNQVMEGSEVPEVQEHLQEQDMAWSPEL